MKLVDKYLLREYSVPVAYCLCAFSMMYVVFDLFARLSDFMDAKTTIPQASLFYFHYLFTINGNAPFLVMVLPVSLLLGALYSLAQLTRCNELTALRACGLSLPRLMAPFMAVGLACSVVAAIVQETIAPRSSRWTYRFEKRELGDGKTSNAIPNFPYYNSATHRHWMIDLFTPENPTIINGVKIVQERPDSTRELDIMAKCGTWLDGRWWFDDVQTRRYDRNGDPTGSLSPPSPHPVEMLELTEAPSDFASEVQDWEILSSLEMVKYLRTHPDLSPQTRARKVVDLYNRLAMPWTCIVVVLLGIPAGARTGRQGVLIGVILAITMFFCFYAMMHFSIFLGKRQLIWPWLAAWLPNLLFATVGLVMLRRMR